MLFCSLEIIYAFIYIYIYIYIYIDTWFAIDCDKKM